MAGKKSHWLDDDTDEPMIAEQAQRLEAFLAAMADGRVDEGELQAQQQRLANLMREVEPLLDEKLHAKVTQLLCELTAYDMMHAVYTMQQARPKTAFRG
jgi:hypothetical protein